MKILWAMIWAMTALLILALIVSGGIYLITASLAGDRVSPPPEKITASSVCPVADCAAATCHGADPAPELTAGQTMACPKVGCRDSTCHAADRLTSHYQSPKTSSLNVWIVGLSLFTLAMIVIALYVR